MFLPFAFLGVDGPAGFCGRPSTSAPTEPVQLAEAILSASDTVIVPEWVSSRVQQSQRPLEEKYDTGIRISIRTVKHTSAYDKGRGRIASLL